MSDVKEKVCEVSVEDWTFEEHDKLKRGIVAKQFSSIILSNAFINIEHKGLVVALDSSWGTGKTSFIHMWKNMLGDKYEEQKLNTVYYNAWENDDYEHALVPIIAETYKNDGRKKIIAKKAAKVILMSLGEQVIRNKTGIDVKEITSNIEESITNNYEKHKQNKSEFKKELSKLTDNGDKVIIFIDELDRCRPKFAIETLEAIKHYLDIDNMIFVFSVDMEQLSHSIATLYGQNMDASGYLARFFDLQLRLPEPSYERYINFLNRINVALVHDCIYNTRVTFKKISIILKLSLRDINHIYQNIKHFILLYKITSTDKAEIYLFLIALKYKNPSMLYTILHENYINYTNSTNVRVKKIDEDYYKINDSISEFLRKFHLGTMNTEFIQIADKYNRFKVDNDYDHMEPVYRYIERKLEFLNYIKHD